jgi:hypothetical protein
VHPTAPVFESITAGIRFAASTNCVDQEGSSCLAKLLGSKPAKPTDALIRALKGWSTAFCGDLTEHLVNISGWGVQLREARNWVAG